MDEEEGEIERGRDEPESTVEEEGGGGGGGRRRKSSRTSRKDSKKKDSKASTLGAGKQQLFLVEFLVDTVSIDSFTVDEEVLDGQTCLSLSFLNFPPMEICEKDFNSDKGADADKVKFNCGKSLMFALNETQCERPPPLALEITVFKKLGEGENPVKVEIGVIKICISELFRQIVDTARFKPEKLPVSKSIKDCFMLVGPGKRTMGQVSVYIRFSCLGQNVVTEFQCGPDLRTSPVLFKSREGRKMFEFSGSGAFANGEGEDAEDGKDKPGCGCIPPRSSQIQGNRGQGDGGRSRSVTATYSQGNKVLLDVPNKPNRAEDGRNGTAGKGGRNTVPGKGGDCEESADGDDDDLTVATLNPNPDQNVFVLRVGDKGQIPDRGKMILEFKTPKQKIPPKVLPPYHEDVAVQTDTKKGKGKGKKKGKK